MKKLNPKLIKLVNVLNDCKFHGGDELGAMLGITRSAVWKCIQKLGGYGVKINSVKGKGYSLAAPLIVLEEKKIKQQLNSEIKKLLQLTVLETIPSTNSYLKTVAMKMPFAICLAEHQSNARGRFARNWFAPFAQNIYFSCRYRFSKDISELGGLSLVMGLALVKALQQFGINNIAVKWPNDILWQGRKLAGTLIEVNAESHGFCEVILGIGLNVNMLAQDDEIITQPWTSLQQIADKYFDRNNIVAVLIATVIQYIQEFEQHGLDHFMQQWQANDHLHGQSITLLNGVEEIHGRAQGINEQGHLMLKLSDGTLRAFSSGEASIKKIPL